MKGGFAVAAFFFALAFFGRAARAVDLPANVSDTFIFEAAQSEEFSSSEVFAVSRFKSERAIAYLPFTARGIDVGLDERTDKIISASLSLYIKDLPLFSAEKEEEARKGEPEEKAAPPEKAEKPPASPLAGSEESSATSSSGAEPEAEEEKAPDEKNVIRISVLGIVDDPAFEPNSKAFRVSWDGKNDAPAPKHDPVDGRIDMAGVFKLGTIELDIGRNKYEDGDKIEFESRELTDFMNFAYGVNSAQKLHSDIHSHLEKIENFAIILKQESGERGVIFHSADSYGDAGDSPENDGAEKSREPPENPDSGDAQNPRKAEDGDKRGGEKSAEPDDSFAEIKKLPPEKMRAELEKFLYTSDGMRKYIEESGIRYDSPLSCPPDADIEGDENNGENKADSASARRGGDRRPKITFEHVRTVEPKEP